MYQETELLHVGDAPADWEGAVNPPVYHASLFSFESLQQFRDYVSGEAQHYAYTRVANPTTRVLERKIAFLEKAEDAVAVASGMGAITTTLLTLLQAGDHLLVADCTYGRGFCTQRLASLGVEVETFTSDETSDLSARIRSNTRVIYLESPGGGGFRPIQDLRAVARVARQNDVTTIIDNTYATPLFQNPIALGIDLVVHSVSKYIGGHSDLVMGLVVGSSDLIADVRKTALQLGGTPSPSDAYLAVRGLRTLPLRMARHQESAFRVARWLESRPEILKVWYPGLESFPGHDLAKTQMTGYPGLFSFQMPWHGWEAKHRFVDSLLSLFSLGYSWGGFESLVLPNLQRHEGQETDRYRLSIGLEHPEDLIGCLENALEARAQDG